MFTMKAIISKQDLIAGATRCFERFGIRRTSMNDIADEAKVSRNTLYRFYSDRTALVADVLVARVMLAIDAMRDFHDQHATLESALVETPIFALRILQKDAVFNDILENSADRQIESIALNGTPEIREAVAAVWRPSFKQARKSGELTSTRSDERLIEGIREIAGLMTLRNDLDEEGQRRFLSDFLIPAILRS